MISKKYFIVKDVENQAGGINPYKVISLSPLILGCPIFKYSQYTSLYQPIPIVITSPLTNITLSVPYIWMRPIIENLYRLKQLEPPYIKKLVSFGFKTPQLKTSIPITYYTLLKIIEQINERFKRKPELEYSQETKRKIYWLLDSIINKLLKNDDETEYTPIDSI